MFKGISNILNDLNSILVPHLCFGCNATLSRGEHLLCTVCRNQVPFTDYNFDQENAVDRIFYGQVRVEKAVSFLFFYEEGLVKNLIHYLKYKNQSHISDFLGEWYGNLLSKQPNLPQLDWVIPVPLHPTKKRKRGYNQVNGFGRGLAKHLKAQYVEDGILKTANTKTQTQKGRLFRWQGKKALYQANGQYNPDGKSILLVDDVITTGSTLVACAQALRQAGDCKLYIATMAMVP